MTPKEVASKYIGQTEKPGNMGFTDFDFEKRMRLVGFEKTHAWCAYFAELVFKEAYPEKFFELDKLFSASTVKTFNNFRDAAYLIGYAPQVNSLVIWQSYRDSKPLSTGHAGIVVSVEDHNSFHSVEGNTNDGGGREGYIVALKKREVMADVKNGLKILGFIQM